MDTTVQNPELTVLESLMLCIATAPTTNHQWQYWKLLQREAASGLFPHTPMVDSILYANEHNIVRTGVPSTIELVVEGCRWMLHEKFEGILEGMGLP